MRRVEGVFARLEAARYDLMNDLWDQFIIEGMQDRSHVRGRSSDNPSILLNRDILWDGTRDFAGDVLLYHLKAVLGRDLWWRMK